LRRLAVILDPHAPLESHGPYMSDEDEAEIIRRMVESDDVAELALRTCMCGRRLEGFDDYFEHLRAVVREATQLP
jgi:ribulose-5-phosphate 4-epimerase/fuculose-1-phosphate aldolase